MTKIVVVGHADIINKGELIDSFDIVVRVKSYALMFLEKFKKDIGCKADIVYDHKKHIQEFQDKYNCDFRKYDISLKKELSKKNDNYITNGILAIFQALKDFGPPIHIIGFEFDNDLAKRKTIFSKEKKFIIWHKKHFPSLLIHKVEGKKKKFGVSHYEDKVIEGKLIEEAVNKGNLIWLK